MKFSTKPCLNSFRNSFIRAPLMALSLALFLASCASKEHISSSEADRRQHEQFTLYEGAAGRTR